MQDIHYNKKIYVIPDNWNELSGKQLIKVAGYINGKNNNPELAELKMLKALMSVSDFRFGYLNNDLKARLLPYIQWIAENENTLTENLLPCYKKNIFSKKMYGPEKEFNNLRMVEFHYTEVAYKFLRETDDVDYLNELVAVLYRPGKTNYDFKRNVDGDVREVFNDATIELNKKIVSRWPLAVKQAILMWYDGCRQQLIEDYPLVYSGKKSTENYYAGLYNMIRSVAGEKYGTMDKVEQLSVHTAHLELTCIIEDAQRLEEAYKKQA